MIGEWPTWGEDLLCARRRYAARFLTYLNRHKITRRNFIIVTHADCVGAALSMMPSQVDQLIQSVEYGGLFFASRVCKASEAKLHPHRNSAAAVSTGFAARTSVGSTQSTSFVARASAPSTSLAAGGSTGSASSSTAPPTLMPHPPAAPRPLSTWMGRRRRPATNNFSAVCPTVDIEEDISPGAEFPRSDVASLYDSGEEDNPDPLRLFGVTQSAPVAHHGAWHVESQGSDGDARTAEACAAPEKDWQVHTHDIILRQKPTKKSSKSITAVISKRVKLLTKDSQFSYVQIEQLLGSMSDAPLGKGDSETEVLSRLAASGVPQHSFTTTSLSTYLFGGSECGSNFGGDFEGSFGPDSRIHTQTSIDENLVLPGAGCLDDDLVVLVNSPDVVARSRERASTMGERRSQRRHSAGPRHGSPRKSSGAPISPQGGWLSKSVEQVAAVASAHHTAGKGDDSDNESNQDELSPLPLIRSERSSTTGGHGPLDELKITVQRVNLRESTRRKSGKAAVPMSCPALSVEPCTSQRRGEKAAANAHAVPLSLPAAPGTTSAAEFVRTVVSALDPDDSPTTFESGEPDAEPDAVDVTTVGAKEVVPAASRHDECWKPNAPKTIEVIIDKVPSADKEPIAPLKLGGSALMKRRRSQENTAAAGGGI